MLRGAIVKRDNREEIGHVDIALKRAKDDIKCLMVIVSRGLSTVMRCKST